MTETKKLNADKGVLKMDGKEIDVTGFKHDLPELTVKNDDGTERTFENVEIKTQEQIKEERQELHERAPERIKFDEVDGCSDPTDIDDLISFLQSAKEQGAEWVNVNDDGREMKPRPQITNSYREYWHGPKPSECTEYVVL